MKLLIKWAQGAHRCIARQVQHICFVIFEQVQVFPGTFPDAIHISN